MEPDTDGYTDFLEEWLTKSSVDTDNTWKDGANDKVDQDASLKPKVEDTDDSDDSDYEKSHAEIVSYFIFSKRAGSVHFLNGTHEGKNETIFFQTRTRSPCL